MAWGVPKVSSIQHTNVIILASSSSVLAVFLSSSAALGCLLGGAVVIGNLYLLSILGRVAISIASGGSAGAVRLGVLAIPLKLLIVVGLLYLVFKSVPVDGLGFGLGVLTQMAAIIIETARASTR